MKRISMFSIIVIDEVTSLNRGEQKQMDDKDAQKYSETFKRLD